jgi:hypothetical protein
MPLLVLGRGRGAGRGERREGEVEKKGDDATGQHQVVTYLQLWLLMSLEGKAILAAARLEHHCLGDMKGGAALQQIVQMLRVHPSSPTQR